MLTPLRTRISSFWYGFTLPVRALRLIVRTPSLFAWAAAPILLTLALSVWGVTWMKTKLMMIGLAWIASLGYSPESWTVQAAIVLMQIALFVLAAVSFSLIAGIIASPLNDFLAETTEAHCEPRLPALPPEAATFRWRVRAVRIDITKTVLVALVQIALVIGGLLGFWIPGLNLVPLLLAFWLLAFQFTSYPQTRRGERFGVSVRFLFRHTFATLGFGAAVGLLFAVPILSAFALPLAVVGGTLLYARGNAPLLPLK